MKDEIFVKEGEYVLPFSPWVLAQEIMPTGIYPEKAHAIARKIGEELKDKGKRFVTPATIKKLTIKHLSEINPDLAERYQVWQAYRDARVDKKIKEPLIVLVGGATGSGKSTVALEVAHRLGIRNVIGTDYVRQILRTMFSEEILPDIHVSTYAAWETLRVPIAPGEDKIAVGYVEQAKHVLVGIEAIIERALKEGTDVLIEGIHILPSILNRELLENPCLSAITLNIESEDAHKVRFFQRSEYSARVADDYLKELNNIRKIQSYLVEQSSSHGVPVVNNVAFDKTIETIIGKITGDVQEIMAAHKIKV